MSVKLKFIGASEGQINWGSNDNPNLVLTKGDIYELEEMDIRSWHTKIKLVGIDGLFNSASFKGIENEN